MIKTTRENKKEEIEIKANPSKGITLIALVITIIVLLILAGVSIAMLSGDNSILTRGAEAKTSTDKAQIEERIKTSYLAALTEGHGVVTEETFVAELKKEFGVAKIEDTNATTIDTTSTQGKWIVTIDNSGPVELVAGISTPTPFTSNFTAEELTALETNGIAEITGNEITNENLKENSRIKGVITGQVPLTTEMTYITGTLDTGVVVAIGKTENDTGNEFVWVPVPVAIATSAPDSSTGIDLSQEANKEALRPMAILQSGSSTNYQGLLYDFSGTTSTAMEVKSVTGASGYREPATLSGFDTDTAKPSGSEVSYLGAIGLTASEFASKIQSDYNKMVASVNKYGGFFVARYELGLEGTTKKKKKASELVTTATAENSNTNRWYGLYSKTNGMYEEAGSQNFVSQMIWGSQYDAMMNWMAKTGTTVGIANSNKYNTAQTTGSKEKDKINNVYDLYGCHWECTQEALHTYGRAYRGGRYSSSSAPAYRLLNNPNNTKTYYSSRPALYIRE